MTDWRRYTTTPLPQVAWSLLGLGIVVAVVVGVAAHPPVIVAVVGVRSAFSTRRICFCTSSWRPQSSTMRSRTVTAILNLRAGALELDIPNRPETNERDIRRLARRIAGSE